MRTMVLALLLATGAAPAPAQTPPSPPDDASRMPRGPMGAGMLMRADANGDGIVTREEAAAAADRRFERLDANHDGTVTTEEMVAARDAIRGARSGGNPPPDATRPMPPRPAPEPMTREQSRARTREVFDRADANHDGRVDAAELAAMRPVRGGDDVRRGNTPPPPPQD